MKYVIFLFNDNKTRIRLFRGYSFSSWFSVRILVLRFPVKWWVIPSSSDSFLLICLLFLGFQRLEECLPWLVSLIHWFTSKYTITPSKLHYCRISRRKFSNDDCSHRPVPKEFWRHKNGQLILKRNINTPFILIFFIFLKNLYYFRVLRNFNLTWIWILQEFRIRVFTRILSEYTFH